MIIAWEYRIALIRWGTLYCFLSFCVITVIIITGGSDISTTACIHIRIIIIIIGSSSSIGFIILIIIMNIAWCYCVVQKR